MNSLKTCLFGALSTILWGANFNLAKPVLAFSRRS
jgi:hypothetical protein